LDAIKRFLPPFEPRIRVLASAWIREEVFLIAEGSMTNVEMAAAGGFDVSHPFRFAASWVLRDGNWQAAGPLQGWPFGLTSGGSTSSLFESLPGRGSGQMQVVSLRAGSALALLGFGDPSATGVKTFDASGLLIDQAEVGARGAFAVVGVEGGTIQLEDANTVLLNRDI
jgi:hypothetical protein